MNDINVHEKGFLHESNFTALEKKTMKQVTQWTMLPQDHLELTENGLTTAYTAVKYQQTGSRYEGDEVIYKIPELPEVYTGAAYQVTDTVFLLDEMQLYHMWKNFGDVKALMRSSYTNEYNFWLDYGGYYSYYLRTPTGYGVSCVPVDERYEYYYSPGSTNGIRPAFYLEEDNAKILSGNGTAEDPYIVTGRDIRVSIEGNEQEFDQGAIVRKGEIYVPLRAIAEEMGAQVSWEEEGRKVIIEAEGTTVEVAADMQEIYINGEMGWLPAPVIIKNDRTLVPLQVLTAGLGLSAEWDENAETIRITSGK